MFYRSERLLLRPVWPEDWKAIFGGIADEGVVRNLASAPWPYRECDAKAFAQRPHDAHFPNFLITQPTRNGSLVLGSAGIAPHEGSTELGYWIARPYWGRGFGTEAARAVINVARVLGHRRMIASHHFDNPASGRILRKLGFVATGKTERRYCAGRDAEVDGPVYERDLSDAPADVMRAA